MNAGTGQIKSVAMVASGNLLEMYDFMVFGYYAPAIAKTLLFSIGRCDNECA
jgi:hypothetical protein